MAVKLENASDTYAIVDGVQFTSEDAKNAKHHASLKADGELKRGRVSGTDLTTWFNEGAIEYDVPDKVVVAKDNGAEVIATLVYKKILANGKLAKAEQFADITRKMIRDERGPKRGRISSDNYLNVSLKILEGLEDVAPIEIREVNDTIHTVEETETGSYTAAKNRTATESVLRDRIAELEKVLSERKAD